jgi:hypothetical protein
MTIEIDAPELRQARLLAMMHAAESAGLTPIPVMELHAFVFVANVLSPVWDLVPRKRSVKRRKGGPYFPDVQADIDHLVGRGVISIRDLSHVQDWDGKWLLEGRFTLNFGPSKQIVEQLLNFDDEARLSSLFSELAFAFAELSPIERLKIVGQDATYADNRTGEGAIIDFAEWRSANYSFAAANFFDRVMPDGLPASPAEKLHLYVQHMRRRLGNGG